MQIKALVWSQVAIQISGISNRQFVFPQFIVHSWRGDLHHLVCPGYIKSLYISQLSPYRAQWRVWLKHSSQKDARSWSVDCRKWRMHRCSWFTLIVSHHQGWKCRCLASGCVSTFAEHLYVASARWHFETQIQNYFPVTLTILNLLSFGPQPFTSEAKGSCVAFLRAISS